MIVAHALQLKEMVKEIRQKAEEAGVDNLFLFETTLKRYETLVDTCGKLEKICNDTELMVTKEYVKGRGNVYVHPVIRAYNQTVSTANKTAETLMKMISALEVKAEPEPDSEIDPLMEILNR